MKSVVALNQGNSNKLEKLGRLLAQGSKGLYAGAAFLPDAVYNMLAKKVGSDFRDPAEKLGNFLFSLDQISPPQTRAEEVISSIGSELGGLFLPGGVAAKSARTISKGSKASKIGEFLSKNVLGVGKKGDSIVNPTLASTLGSAMTQGVAQPYINEELGKGNLGNFVASVAAGVLGGGLSARALGKALSKPKNVLPLETAAQTSLREKGRYDPDTLKLQARQIDLGKYDPEVGLILKNMQLNQHKNILNKLPQSGNTTYQDISQKINNYVSGLKSERSGAYKKTEKELFGNVEKPNNSVENKNSFNFIDTKLKEYIPSHDMYKKLNEVKNKLSLSNNNPYPINNTRKEIFSSLKPFHPLYPGSSESKIMNEVANEIGTDLERHFPGYEKNLNEPYRIAKENVGRFENGAPADRIVRMAEGRTPGNVFEEIFENTDPNLIKDVKEALGENLYRMGADEYISNLSKKLQTTSSKRESLIPMLNDIKKNIHQLRGTLPSDKMDLLENIMKDIDVSEFGLPSGDWVSKGRRQVWVGDEIKGMGMNKNSLISDLFNRAMMKGKKNFLLEEMLTGTPISTQVADTAGRAARHPYLAAVAQTNPESNEPIGQEKAMTYSPMDISAQWEAFDRGRGESSPQVTEHLKEMPYTSVEDAWRSFDERNLKNKNNITQGGNNGRLGFP